MNALTLRQLEYVVAVADELHFGRAAMRCNVSQPGLSSQIRALETSLGTQLFERTRRRVAVTAAGAAFVDRARRILADVADLGALADVHAGDVVGDVEVAADPTVAGALLPATVATLRRLWPHAALQLSEHRPSELVAGVADGTFDLGLAALPVATDGLVVHPLVEEPLDVVVPLGHPSPSGSVTAPELAGEQLLVLDDAHSLHHHAVDAAARLGLERIVEVPAASLTTLAQMVAAGAGITLLPRSTIGLAATPEHGVTTRQLAGTSVTRALTMVWRPTDPHASLFRAAAERLAPRWATLVEQAAAAHLPPVDHAPPPRVDDTATRRG